MNTFKQPGPDSIEGLAALCADHAKAATVRRIKSGAPDWRIDQHRLHHVSANYFQICGFEEADGRRRLIMDQPESALLMLLLVINPEGGRNLVLSLRNEPGLIGGTNLSGTIQSTPSNFLRRHGGRATPFIDLAATPRPGSRIVWDSIQYDWGAYYRSKTKRFLIIEIEGPVEIEPGLIELDAALAPDLLRSDDLITCDLRAILAAYLALRDEAGQDVERPGPGAPAAGRQPSRPLALEHFTSSKPDLSFEDDYGTGVAFFETMSPSREVPAWRQPLMISDTPIRLSLPTRIEAGVKQYAVAPGLQAGLEGRELLFPARAGTVPDGAHRTVTTSAEGGRFYKSAISLTLGGAAGDESEARHVTITGDTQWIDAAQLRTLALTPCATSLDLRLLWSLACADG